MVEILVTVPFGDEFADALRAVDERLRVRAASGPLRQLLRGELPEDAAVVDAARRDAAAALAECEVIVGWARFPVELLPLAPRLRWIQALSAGVDRLDERVLARVTLTNGSGLGAEPIAEHVICMLLMLARNMPLAVRRQIDGVWSREGQAREIAGMTMGVVGMGAIGAAVARRARALGLRVIGVRRSATGRGPDAVADEVCPPSELASVLAGSDVVVLATPLTAETRGLIGAAELAQMKPGAYLINIARGAVVDEAALIEALERGHLGGAGLDVFAQEPLPGSSPLWAMPNVIITPHVSTSSDRYQERVRALVQENLRRYLAGEPLKNVVDQGRGY